MKLSLSCLSILFIALFTVGCGDDGKIRKVPLSAIVMLQELMNVVLAIPMSVVLFMNGFKWKFVTTDVTT